MWQLLRNGSVLTQGVSRAAIARVRGVERASPTLAAVAVSYWSAASTTGAYFRGRVVGVLRLSRTAPVSVGRRTAANVSRRLPLGRPDPDKAPPSQPGLFGPLRGLLRAAQSAGGRLAAGLRRLLFGNPPAAQQRRRPLPVRLIAAPVRQLPPQRPSPLVRVARLLGALPLRAGQAVPFAR